MSMLEALTRNAPECVPQDKASLIALHNLKASRCLRSLKAFDNTNIQVVGHRLYYPDSTLYRPIIERQYERGLRLIDLDKKNKRATSTIDLLLEDSRRTNLVGRTMTPTTTSQIIPAIGSRVIQNSKT
jgi:hypothetical protein